MTKYLSTGRDSTPLEDFRAANKLIEKEIRRQGDPFWSISEEELYEMAKKHHAKTGSWPSHLVDPSGLSRKIPKQQQEVA